MYTILLPIDESYVRAQRAAGAVIDLPGNPKEKSSVLLNVFEKIKQR